MHRSKHKNRDDDIFYYVFITKKMSLDWHSIEIRYIQSFAFDSWICWLNFHHGHFRSIGHDQMCQCLVGTRLLKLFQRLCDYFPSVKHEAIPWEHFVTDSRFFFVVWVYRIPISNKMFPHYINSIQNKLVVEIYGQALMSRVKFWYKNKTVWNNTKTFIYIMRLVWNVLFSTRVHTSVIFLFFVGSLI